MSYSSVSVTTRNPHEHRDLIDFCEARNLNYEENILINFSILDDTYRKPTKALKAFCGSEHANSDGYIQPKIALELVLRTAHRLNLDRAGGVIELNETLKCALETEDTSILVSTLPTRISALFSKA